MPTPLPTPPPFIVGPGPTKSGGGPPEGGAACSGGYGHSPTPGELTAYSSQLAAGADGTSIQIDLLASDQYYRDAGANPLGFVTRIYDDVLRRDPTPVEVATAIATLARSRDTARTDLAQEIILGPEARAIRVDNAFHTLLGRYPDSAEVALWVNRLPGSGSTTGILGTTMVEEIAGSAEFYVEAGDSPTAFMSTLYSDLLSRPPSLAELSSDAHLSNEIGTRGASARLSAVEAVVLSPAFRTAEITSFFDNYLHPTCQQLAAQECVTSSVQTPTPDELSAALTSLASNATEETVTASVLGSDEYYQNHQSTQTGLVQGVYQDLLGRAPTDLELSAALAKYTNDSIGHMAFAQDMVGSIPYQDRTVSLDYQRMLLRAPYSFEMHNGEGVLRGGVTSLQTPDEALLETIFATPEYYADTGGSDSDFVARTIDVLLTRPGTMAEESAYLKRSAPHDARWQVGVGETIVDSTEYRTDFVRGVYETYLTFKVCASDTGRPVGDAGLLRSVGGTLAVGLLIGALVIGIGTPLILRRRT